MRSTGVRRQARGECKRRVTRDRRDAKKNSPRAKLALSSRLLLLALIAKNLSLFWRLSIK